MSEKRLKKSRRIIPNRLIAEVFFAIILAGTALLMLPAASRSGKPCDFLSALFTATSATCVTGLTPFDTWTQWSGFGQIVLLVLIQVGGLGFMSIASMLIFILRARLGMVEQAVMAQSLGAEDIHSAVQLQKWMFKMCLLFEGCGAALLTIRFLFDFDPLTAVELGVFHSVSAFCNAGFDLLGFISPGASISVYGKDPAVLGILSALIILGGLGFIVWQEIAEKRSLRRLSVYARLVLAATAGLLLFGTALTAAAEWNNPATLGGMTVPEKLLAAFFQSVTLRTAGFAGIPQAALTDAGKSVSLFLMLIGGSSASTAGGLKTVTLVVILLFLWSRLRGRNAVVVYHRTIPSEQVLNALTIFGVMVGLSFFGASVIAFLSPIPFMDALFETVSAIATVGLSCDRTAQLPTVGKILIILYMYFGRVGVLTISLGFLKGGRPEPRFRYASASILIG